MEQKRWSPEKAAVHRVYSSSDLVFRISELSSNVVLQQR